MTPAQQRMLENLRDGRPMGHGFASGKYAGRPAAAVAAAIYRKGWVVHSEIATGPPMLLTEAGRDALRAQLEGARP